MQHTYDSRSALARVDELRGGEMRNARDVPRLRLDVVQPEAGAAFERRQAASEVHFVREKQHRDSPILQSWVSEHVIKLFLGDADAQLIFAVYDVDYRVALPVVRLPQVTVRARARHIKHRESNIIFRKLLDLEANSGHHFRIL